MDLTCLRSKWLCLAQHEINHGVRYVHHVTGAPEVGLGYFRQRCMWHINMKMITSTSWTGAGSQGCSDMLAVYSGSLTFLDGNGSTQSRHFICAFPPHINDRLHAFHGTQCTHTYQTRANEVHLHVKYAQRKNQPKRCLWKQSHLH